MDTLNLAGLAMIANVLCSVFLLAKLHSEPLSGELFALPNAWLGPRPRWLSLRLLRAKFFLPWVQSPPEMSEFPLATRAIFWSARLSGSVFVVAIFAFLASIFIGAH